MAKKYRGHCDLDTIPQPILDLANKGRVRRSRIERLRAEGCNIPVGHDVSDLADWEVHLLFA